MEEDGERGSLVPAPVFSDAIELIFHDFIVDPSKQVVTVATCPERALVAFCVSEHSKCTGTTHVVQLKPATSDTGMTLEYIHVPIENVFKVFTFTVPGKDVRTGAAVDSHLIALVWELVAGVPSLGIAAFQCTPPFKRTIPKDAEGQRIPIFQDYFKQGWVIDNITIKGKVAMMSRECLATGEVEVLVYFGIGLRWGLISILRRPRLEIAPGIDVRVRSSIDTMCIMGGATSASTTLVICARGTGVLQLFRVQEVDGRHRIALYRKYVIHPGSVACMGSMASTLFLARHSHKEGPPTGGPAEGVFAVSSIELDSMQGGGGGDGGGGGSAGAGAGAAPVREREIDRETVPRGAFLASSFMLPNGLVYLKRVEGGTVLRFLDPADLTERIATGVMLFRQADPSKEEDLLRDFDEEDDVDLDFDPYRHREDMEEEAKKAEIRNSLLQTAQREYLKAERKLKADLEDLVRGWVVGPGPGPGPGSGSGGGGGGGVKRKGVDGGEMHREPRWGPGPWPKSDYGEGEGEG